MSVQERLRSELGRTSWRHLRILLGLGVVLGVATSAAYVLAQLRDLQARAGTLQQQAMTAGQELKALEQRHAQLAQQYQQVSTDRDNLLAQVRTAFKEREQALAERELLEQVFKRTAAERLDLLHRLMPFETQLAELQREQERLDGERIQLERALAKAQDRSQEQKLRGQLTQLQHSQSALHKVLRDTKRELQIASRREQKATAHLTTLAKRSEALQHEYTEQVSENATLRRKVDRLPKNVTSLAREHERLLKDLADTHYNMGVMFTKKKDYGRAAKEFQQVIELRPDDTDAHYNLGVIYAEHLPDREKAMKLFRKYLAMNPKGQDASWAKQYIATWQAWEGKERLE